MSELAQQFRRQRWNVAERRVGHSWNQLSPSRLRPVVLVLAGLGTGVAAASQPVITIAGLVAALCLLVVPKPTTLVASLWVLLVRPDAPIISRGVASVTITETEILLGVATVGAVLVAKSDRSSRVAGLPVALLLAWPVWMVIRSFFGLAGAPIIGSPGADLRFVFPFLALVPIVVLSRSYGRDRILRWVCFVGYAACALAILSWALYLLGLLSPGRYPFVFIGTNPLVVRPGGEAIVPVAAVASVLGFAPKLLGTRLVPVFLVVSELVLSQTLSLVVAVAGAVLLTAGFFWAQVPRFGKLGSLLVVVVFVLVSTGALGSGSRFNLEQRTSENSAQYRVEEFNQVSNILVSDPNALLLGAGVGSNFILHFSSTYEVKKDTHNPYLTVTFKTGLFGLLLYVLPMAAGLVSSMFGRRSPSDATLLASLVAVLLANFTVPFLWTTPGACILLVLLVLIWTSRKTASEVNVSWREQSMRIVKRDAG